MLIANKIDLPTRSISVEKGKELANQHKISYFEISVKSGNGMEELFNYVIKEICDRDDARKKVNRLTL